MAITFSNFVTTDETITSGAPGAAIEPNVTVTDTGAAPGAAADYYTVSSTGFVSGDALTYSTPPGGGQALTTCGGPNGTLIATGVSNDPNYAYFPTSSPKTPVSAADVTAFFDSVTFASTAAPHDVTFTFADRNSGTNGAPDASMSVTVHVVAAPTSNPLVTGGSANQSVADNATTQPFTAVTVTNTNAPANPETVTVTLSNAANGALSGGGFTATATAGVYTYAATSAADAQAALHAVVFTPTPNQVSPGQTVSTGFTIQVADGSATSTDAVNSVTATSVNDAPALGGLQASATQPSAGSVVLQPGLTITDPDANASATSAQVAISSGLTAGDRLTVSNLPAGVTSSYNAATGVLTLTGGSSDPAYQAALRTVTFAHDGAVAAGTRTIGFTVVDDLGAASNSANETVNVGGYSPPTTPTNPAQPPSQQSGYTTQTDNLVRVAPNDPALTDSNSSIYAQVQAERAIAAQLDQGRITAADAQTALFHLVDGTTSVAEIDYAFFTGRTPSAAGLNYLVHSSANATDLNDAYYQQFSTENRYINFAVNLATGQGAGAAAFQANYGSLSLSDATAKAYAAIFGVAPAPGKVDAILNAQVSNGLGGLETRAQYFADITGGSSQAQKAAAIGFLLADSVREGFGTYQQADLHFLQDLAHGTAAYNVDLLAAYSQAPNLVGQPVSDPTLGN